VIELKDIFDERAIRVISAISAISAITSLYLYRSLDIKQG